MELFSLLVFGLLIVVSPGADFVLTFRNSNLLGRKAGIYTALGISMAIGVHIFYSIAGLGFVISTNDNILRFVQIFGALYLIYLGLTGLIELKKSANSVERQFKYVSFWGNIRQGFICNLFNPKTMLFFISLFSQLISSSTPSNNMALFYGAYLLLLHFIWFTLVAILVTHPSYRPFIFNHKIRLNQICSLGLICFGVLLVFKV